MAKLGWPKSFAQAFFKHFETSHFCYCVPIFINQKNASNFASLSFWSCTEKFIHAFWLNSLSLSLSLSLSPKHSQTPTYTPSLSLSHKALSRSHPFTHKLNKPQSRRVTIANSTLLSLREHSLNNIHILLSQTLATTPLSLTFYLINHTHIHSIFHLITPF